MLATFTMRPQPAASMSGRTSRVHKNVPVKLMPTILSHNSRSVRVTGADSAMPALFTRIAIGPLEARHFSNASRTCASSLTSARVPARAADDAHPRAL